MSVFLWKTNESLKIIVQIFDFLLKIIDFHRLSMKSSKFKWKTDEFLRLVSKYKWTSNHVQRISTKFYDNYSSVGQYTSTSMNTITRMKSLDVLLKTPWFSGPCGWFRFAIQRSLKSFQTIPWSRLPPKVHLRRKVKYWKCHGLSALHFPEIEGSRF